MNTQDILDAIAASPELQALADERNDTAIAAILSVGRTRFAPTEIGFGTLLEVLGLTAGNIFIDALLANSMFRHVRPLLEQGRLRLDSPLVRGAVQGFVPMLLTDAQARSLLDLARRPDPIDVALVSAALNGEV